MHHSQPSLLRDVRPLIAHLYPRKAWIYWCDLAISMTIAYSCAGYYLWEPLSWTTMLAFAIAVFGIYRLSLFMHEIVHFHKGEMRLFTIAWNLWVGIPMLIPSFFYEPHRQHHAGEYGTEHDGEYLPLAHGGWWGLCKYLGEIFILPIYFVTRFLIGTPITLLFPQYRDWILERHSSFVIDFHYRRKIKPDAPRKVWAWLEVACCLRVIALFVVVFSGAAPWTRIPKIFALGFATLALNHFRTMAAHRYVSEGEAMSHNDQFLDSTNIEGNLFSELLYPLGLRFHALHHLLPGLPYHQLGKAHRILKFGLPATSDYHRASYPSTFAVISELMRNVRNDGAVAETQRIGPAQQRRSADSMGWLLFGGKGVNRAHFSGPHQQPHSERDAG